VDLILEKLNKIALFKVERPMKFSALTNRLIQGFIGGNERVVLRAGTVCQCGFE
jgi:hypothetical protein